MKIEDVKVGMWVRVTGDTRVSRVRSLRDTTVCFDGNPGWAFASACEPWVPQVGDWVVRSSRSGEREAPTTVRQVSTAPGSESTVQLADGCAAYLVPGPMLFHVEPCPPPTVSVQVAPPAPETRTMACEWEESDIYPCDCPRCTGPVSTLLCMPCMGRDWRTWEPEVVRVSVGVESGYMARGRGVEAIHPLRDEAVRLWREKVGR